MTASDEVQAQATDLALVADGVSPEPPSDAPVQVALPPLTISALMVTKADLIAALRTYLPHLTDIEVIDGERFLLTVGAEHPDANGSR